MILPLRELKDEIILQLQSLLVNQLRTYPRSVESLEILRIQLMNLGDVFDDSVYAQLWHLLSDKRPNNLPLF